MKRKKILVVDDNPVDRKALSAKLESNGYDVLLAEDGAVALSTARREKPTSSYLIFPFLLM